jgi:hypothetical protein
MSSQGPVSVTLQDNTQAQMTWSSHHVDQDGVTEYTPVNLFPSDPDEYQNYGKDWISGEQRIPNNQPEWVTLQFSSARRVTEYTLWTSNYTLGGTWDIKRPIEWELQGSNNGTSWTTIHSQTANQTSYFKTSGQAQKTFEISSSTAYIYVRLMISKVTDNATTTSRGVELAGWDLRTTASSVTTTPAPIATNPPSIATTAAPFTTTPAPSSWIATTDWKDDVLTGLSSTPDQVEITLRDGSQATVTSSSYSTINGVEYKASGLFDTDYTTDTKDWVSHDTFPNKVQWVQLKLESPRVISQYTLVSSKFNNSRNPAAWVLQGSNDGSTWTDLHEQTNQESEQYFMTQDQVTKSFPITSGAFSYYRLEFSQAWDGTSATATRVELAGWDLTFDVPMTTPAPIPIERSDIVDVKASSQWMDSINHYVPGKAFNGTNTNGNDCWFSGGGKSLPQWIQATFQDPRRILAYSITTRNTPIKIYPPKTWKLQGYDESTEQWDELDQRNWDGFQGRQNMTERFTTNTNSKAYRTVRLFVEQSFNANTGNINDRYVGIGQLTFEGAPPTTAPPTSPPLPSQTVTLQDGITATMTASSQDASQLYPAQNVFVTPNVTPDDASKDWASGSGRLQYGLTEWVALEFDPPRRVTGYTLVSSAYGTSFNPAAWKLEGSTDRGTNWTTIHSQTPTDASSIDFKSQSQISKTFAIQSSATYNVVRLVISKTWHGDDPTQGDNGYRVDLAEWKLQTTSGSIGAPTTGPGVKVTLKDGTPAEMYAVSSQDPNFPATNLFITPDVTPDDASKDWSSYGERLPNNMTEWVVLKFENARRVTEYTLVSSAYETSYNPAAWVLQGSTDESSWTNIHLQTPTDQSSIDFKSKSQVSKTFAIQSKFMFTYFRLVISATWHGDDPTQGFKGYRVDLAQWDLKTTTDPLGTTPAPGSGFTLQDGTPVKDITSSSQFSTYSPRNLFKSDPNDYKEYSLDWVSGNERLPGVTEWVELEFPGPRRVTEYTLITSTYNISLNPAAWVLEGSNDRSTWTTLDSHTSNRTGYFNVQTTQNISQTYAIQSSAMVTYVRLSISKTWHDDPGQGDDGYRVDLAGWDLKTDTTTLPPTATLPPSLLPQVDPSLYVFIHKETYDTQNTLTLLTYTKTGTQSSLVLEPYRVRDVSQVFLTNTMGFLRNGAGQGEFLTHNAGCLLPMFTMSPGQDARWNFELLGVFDSGAGTVVYEYRITSSCGKPLHSNAGSTAVDLSNSGQGTSWYMINVGTATFN